MNSILIAVGVLLAGQANGSDNRYPPPPATTGQGPATNATGKGALGNAGRTNSTMQPLGKGDDHDAASSERLFQNQHSPSDFGAKKTEPLSNAGGAASGQPRGFPFDDAAKSDQQPGVRPTALMRAMLSPQPGSQLRGVPVRLIEVISTGRTRNDQSQRVDAYWDLCSSVADYYLGLREQDEFRKLGTFVSQPGAAWQQAGKELEVRIDTSLRAARASQFRLASLMGSGTNNLPLPADMPHCGTYISQYEHLFAGRNSPEAYDLAQLLPLRYAELKNTAAGVTRAEELLDGSVRGGSPDGANGIQALELLALRRRAFVQIARDYNRRIARYAELALPGQIGAERLTDMLIIRPTSSSATRSSSSHPTRRQSSNEETGPPPTFANEWSSSTAKQGKRAVKLDEAVHPAAATGAESRTEHSLVVPAR
ncbi:MAG TPA: hypothetical protein VHE81_20310 [Lacipirellulaceae bacterium]|nr:hypothetical protein [Lacipirellulaceae bacterium]